MEGDHRGEGKGDEIFSMRVEKGLKKPLARQIREGVEIELSEATLLNSKSEWNSGRIPRIIIEEGEKQVEDPESGLGRLAMVEKQRRRREMGTTERKRAEKRKKEADGHQGQENGSREAKRIRRKSTEVEKMESSEGAKIPNLTEPANECRKRDKLEWESPTDPPEREGRGKV